MKRAFLFLILLLLLIVPNVARCQDETCIIFGWSDEYLVTNCVISDVTPRPGPGISTLECDGAEYVYILPGECQWHTDLGGARSGYVVNLHYRQVFGGVGPWYNGALLVSQVEVVQQVRPPISFLTGAREDVR